MLPEAPTSLPTPRDALLSKGYAIVTARAPPAGGVGMDFGPPLDASMGVCIPYSTAVSWLDVRHRPQDINLCRRGTRKRHELTPLGERHVGAVLTATAHAHGLHAPTLAFRGCYAIADTDRATSEDHQGWHTDYLGALVRRWVGKHSCPRSAIWAPCAPFLLNTFDHGTVRVPRGHVIFFVSTFWHGGGPSLSLHPRFHGFQLRESMRVPTGVYGPAK